MNDAEKRNKMLLYAGVGVGILLILLLSFNSTATIGLIEQLLTYALAGIVGFYIVTAGVRMGTAG